MTLHHNWSGGEWCAAREAAWFDAPLGEAFERYPRSGAEDAAQALAACRSAAAHWGAVDAAARHAGVERALQLLRADPGPGSRIARALGLDEAESAGLRAELASEHDAELAQPVQPRSGCALFVPGWSAPGAAPARELSALLAAGMGVLMLSDPLMPWIAEDLARALERADLPRGLVALLHGDDDAALRAGLESASITRVVASGPPASMQRLELLDGRLRAAADGAERTLQLTSVRNGTCVVPLDADPALAAASVLERAFGRRSAFSGQRAGALGRVLCHERGFSRFSAEFLHRFDAFRDFERPVAAIARGTLVHARRALQLGLDEGATPLIRSSSALQTEVLDDLERSQPGRDADRLRPVVFTNVEEHMRLAWLGRPAPVLCLMRVPSDDAAHALKLEFDRSPAPEDLSD